MKIQLEKYNPDWTNVYNDIRVDLFNQLEFLNPKIEHIGSTSIFDLSAKPIIDIIVGISTLDQLDKAVEPLINNGYIYYEIFNSVMPYRRFFVKLKSRPDNIFIPKVYYENDEVPNEVNEYKLANIHIFEYNSFHWKRHIAFRDYLKIHADIKNEYQKLKTNLSTLNWQDGSEYNLAKNDFIKRTEEKALEWYEKRTAATNNT